LSVVDRNLIISKSDLSHLARARGELYRTLSGIFIHSPNRTVLEKLLDKHDALSALFLRQYDPLPSKLKTGLEAIRSFADELESGRIDKFADALLVEYTRLLRGVKQSYGPPPPYESVYLGEGVVFGEVTIAVRKEYGEWGFTPAERHRTEPPDHISLELEFMQFLCTREAKAWRKEDQNEAQSLLSIEKRFLEKHLGKWAPKFCETIRRYDKLRFYRGWADITEGWISFDCQLIENSEGTSTKA